MRVRLMLTTLAIGCLAPVAGAWTDDAGDLLNVTDPVLDLLEVNVVFGASQVSFDLTFNGALASPADLHEISGFIDLDVDVDLLTGWPSNFLVYDVLPVPEMGMDYYLLLYSGPEPFAELMQVVDGFEYSIGFYPIVLSGMTASVIVDRCSPGELTGLPMYADYAMAVLIGVNGVFTDRTPEGEEPWVGVPAQGDFNGDGRVEEYDFGFLDSCTSGPAIHQDDPDCGPADLDEDQDVDQDDFGILQLNWTG